MPERPVKAETKWRDRDQRPLVPESMRQPSDAVKRAAWHAWFVVAFHAIRSPKYLAQNVGWSFRGIGRMATGLSRWVQVHDKRDVEFSAGDSAISSREYGSYIQISRDRKAQTRTRFWTTVFGTGVVLVAVLVGLRTNPLTAVLTVLGLVFFCGWQGRPMDRPYIESAVVSSPKARKVTPDMIMRALYAAKLCKETIGPDAPEFQAPGVYREAKGYGAVIDLPDGYTADVAIKRKTDIAAGLRIDEFRLFIEQERGDGGHAGQIRLWIADTDPHKREPVTSPLVKAAKWSLWDDVPFGQDERGRQVAIPMIWTSFLIGALPRMGKTFVLRLLISAAVLDMHARLVLFDGKGGKDHAAAEKVAHAFGAGPDDDVAKALVHALEDLKKDMGRRYATIKRQPDEVCPDGKLTKAMSRDPKLKMPLVLVAIDEFQVYLENPKYGNRILDLLTGLAKLGPAAGIILALATQRPSSAVMKTDFRDVLGVRFAMRVTTREFSEMVLGSGSSKAGLDASKFLASHKGVGILLGADDGPLADKGGQTVHAHMVDLPQFSAICQRGRELREGAGTLTGVAAGEEQEALSDRILDHVVKAFRGDDKAHSDVLCERMAEDYPGLYKEWDPNDLAAALGRYQIRGRNQIWAPRLEDGEGANRRGFFRQPIIDKIAERIDPVPDSPPEDL
jgi:DNA segregation ATPase FtsK/SpoIIIE, S-DNA-T family